MDNEPGFAVIDEDGMAFHIAKTYDQALFAASSMRPDADVWYEGPPPWEPEPAGSMVEPDELAANTGKLYQLHPKEPKLGWPLGEPMRALRLLNLRPMSDEEIMRVSLEDACAKIRPFFPTTRPQKDSKKPVAISTWATPERMVKNLLGSNQKLTKSSRAGVPKSESIGLSLLPADNWNLDEVEEIIRVAESRYGIVRVEPPSGRVGFCASATPQCKASCLVFSGQNLNVEYNTVKKLSLTMALYRAPVAFMRVLYEALSFWQVECECRKIVPFVRLNIYSDLPWELLAPGMFERFRGIRFYDYTKVAGRMPRQSGEFPIPNYDLTFSYSGSKPNVEAMDYEIRQNRRRVAVTFALIGKSKNIARGEPVPRRPPTPGRKETAQSWPYVPEIGLPREFLGLTVIDGDQSDFRPYDPGACVVGLRWKIPHTQDVTAAQARVFIVPGYLVEKTKFVVVEMPRYTAMFGAGRSPPWKDLDYADIASKIEEAT